MRKTLRLTAAGLIGVCAASALAQHSDVLLAVQDNQLITLDEDTLLPAHVFASALGELGIPGYTDDPGYASDSLSPGEIIGFNVTRSLLLWDGAQFVPPPLNERLDISFSSLTVTADSDSGWQEGFSFAQASPSGGRHTHLTFYVKHPDFNPASPFFNPISSGAYVLLLEQTSDMHAASDEYAIVFNNGLTPEQFDQTLAEAETLFSPGCPGDLDDDGAVGLSDLSALLTNYGVVGGATFGDGDFNGDGDVDLADLSELLTYFGITC